MIITKLHYFYTYDFCSRETYELFAEYCNIVNEDVHVEGSFYCYYNDIVYNNVVSVDSLVLSTKSSIKCFPDLKTAKSIQFSSGVRSLGKLEYVNNLVLGILQPEIEIINTHDNIYEFYKEKNLFHTMKIDHLTILDEPDF